MIEEITSEQQLEIYARALLSVRLGDDPLVPEWVRTTGIAAVIAKAGFMRLAALSEARRVSRGHEEPIVPVP